MVFYRKYRPQKIQDLDNDSVRESLYSIFAKNTYPHAFLFTGPKGLGKTSTARIVAKVINCEKHKDVKSFKTEKELEPDNKCSQCLSITNGNNLDVFEIDGASNRGIDEIRDLKEKIKLSPFKAARKIYIIDEVHMLTTEAFNALLKTLEEPPSHAVFILCTTEVHKVPETISSRCFRINFTKATEKELVRSLERIVKGEDLKVQNEALEEIAKLSDGSFRDGAKILEEVSMFAGRKTITADLVNEKYNTLGLGKSVSEMMEAFSSKDVKKGIELCRQLEKQGTDFKLFISELINRLHFMLLVRVGVEKEDVSPQFSLEEIQKLFELLTGAYSQTKYAVLPQMPLEVVVLEWGGVAEDAGGSNATQQSRFSDDAHQSQSVSSKSSRSLSESLLSTSSKKSTSAFDSPQSGLSRSASTNGFFENLIAEVKNHNHLVAGVLRSCFAKEPVDGELTILANSKFHKEKLEDKKTMNLLEESAEKILNKKIKITVAIRGGDSHE